MFYRGFFFIVIKHMLDQIGPHSLQCCWVRERRYYFMYTIQTAPPPIRCWMVLRMIYNTMRISHKDAPTTKTTTMYIHNSKTLQPYDRQHHRPSNAIRKPSISHQSSNYVFVYIITIIFSRNVSNGWTAYFKLIFQHIVVDVLCWLWLMCYADCDSKTISGDVYQLYRSATVYTIHILH